MVLCGRNLHLNCNVKKQFYIPLISTIFRYRVIYIMTNVQMHPIVCITQMLLLVMGWAVFCFFSRVNLCLWQWPSACVLEDHYRLAVIELGLSFTSFHHGEILLIRLLMCLFLICLFVVCYVFSDTHILFILVFTK